MILRVSTLPHTDSFLPYFRFTAATSFTSGWRGLMMSTPASTRSSSAHSTFPSQWKAIFTFLSSFLSSLNTFAYLGTRSWRKSSGRMIGPDSTLKSSPHHRMSTPIFTSSRESASEWFMV